MIHTEHLGSASGTYIAANKEKETLVRYFNKLKKRNRLSNILGCGAAIGTAFITHNLYTDPFIVGLGAKLFADFWSEAKGSARMYFPGLKTAKPAIKYLISKVRKKNEEQALEELISKEDNPISNIIFRAEKDFLNKKVDKAFEKMKIIMEARQECNVKPSLGVYLEAFLTFLLFSKFLLGRSLKEKNGLGAFTYMSRGTCWFATQKLKEATILNKEKLDYTILEAYGRFIMDLDSREQWREVLSKIPESEFRSISPSSEYEVLEHPTNNFHDILIFKRDSEGIKRGYEENLLLEEILRKYAIERGFDEKEFVKITKSIACIEHNGHVYHINKRQPAKSLNDYKKLSEDQVYLALDGLARIHASSLLEKVRLGEQATLIDDNLRINVPLYNFQKELQRRFFNRFPEVDREKVLNELEEIIKAANLSGITCLNHGDPYLTNCLDNGIWIDSRLCRRNPIMDVVGVTQDMRVNLDTTEKIWSDRFKEYSGLDAKLENAHLYALLNNLFQIGSKFNQQNFEEARYYYNRVLESSLGRSLKKHLAACKSEISQN